MPIFFMDYADTDLAIEFLSHGFLCYVAPSSKVFHKFKFKMNPRCLFILESATWPSEEEDPVYDATCVNALIQTGKMNFLIDEHDHEIIIRCRVSDISTNRAEKVKRLEQSINISLERELRSGQSDRTIFGKDTKIEIIIPALNEERTLGLLIRDIRSTALPVKVSMLVIDGGSTDHTIDICSKENVRYILQKGKGKGSAMREAVEHSDADIVVFIDGDGTYSASDLESVIEPLLDDQADMVVGSRVAAKREKGSISTVNTVGNDLFNRTINFAMDSTITDSLSGYRALYRKTFRDLVLFSNSFEIEVEMTVEALAKGYRVMEIPIRYGSRKGSRTKLDPLGDGIKIGRTLLFILMNVNPLKFFGIISLAFFVAGLYPGILVLYEKITTGNIISMPSVVFSSLLFVTGAISFVVGMVSELVVRSRRRLEYLISRKLEE